MAASIPNNLPTFFERFPSWPNDSLASRQDIDAGSRWTIRDIGTFQVLRPNRVNEYPPWLDANVADAEERVNESPAIQLAIKLLQTRWRGLDRAALFRASDTFASFFSLLAEVIEQPPTPTPNRFLRETAEKIAQPASQASSSSSELPSSPLEPPPKRLRESSTDSYEPHNVSGGESNQSHYNQQVKSEPVTNACIYHFLEGVTENTRRAEDAGMRLEWALGQNTFIVCAPHSEFSSKNDGDLVHRGRTTSGQWKRQSSASYCSIEAKSRHNVMSKSEADEAQEAAHLIGMFAQRLVSLDGKVSPPWNVIPLITASQNNISLVLGTFPEEYAKYLNTGEQSGLSAFFEVQEYGPFSLSDPGDFERFGKIVVALVLHLQSFGPFLVA